MIHSSKIQKLKISMDLQLNGHSLFIFRRTINFQNLIHEMASFIIFIYIKKNILWNLKNELHKVCFV